MTTPPARYGLSVVAAILSTDCGDDCQNYFIFCLQSPSTEGGGDDSECPYGTFETGGDTLILPQIRQMASTLSLSIVTTYVLNVKMMVECEDKLTTGLT